jgi:SAM-dependent methyltransferase
MKIKPVVKGIVGLLTFIPGVLEILPKFGTRGTNSAHYCYQVWIVHLTQLWENGMSTIPNTLAELGPGDSLGVGLAAMLCGVNNYYALDATPYAQSELNLQIFDELVDLFKSRSAECPTTGEPDIQEYWRNHSFPSHILTDELLEVSLAEERVRSIRKSLENIGQQTGGIKIEYIVPGVNPQTIKQESVDAILSHAVLEHVLDFEETYQAMHSWLKPGGMMSHVIDFRSHNYTQKWNGHWAYSDSFWNIIMGNRPHLINRQPYSVHLNLIEQNHFKVVHNIPDYRTDGITRSNLAKKWHGISDDDLTCSGAFIQAVK